MEDNIQIIFSFLISIIIFFLFPLYITFEKKDDLAYSLSLKLTNDFVESVRIKGYISLEMYNNYVSNLTATGNMYDITLEHKANKIYPIIYSYNNMNDKKVVGQFDPLLYKNIIVNGKIDSKSKIISNGVTYTNLILGYKECQEIYTENQILPVLEKEKYDIYSKIKLDTYTSKDKKGSYTLKLPYFINMFTVQDIDKKDLSIYTMNTGDEFNITIKNTNTSTATAIFNMLTARIDEDSHVRVYINYGGSIISENYW